MLSLMPSWGHWLPLLLDAAFKSALVSALALAALLALRRAPAATRHLALLAGLGVLLGLPALMLLLPRQALPRQALPRPAPVFRDVVNTASALPAPTEQAPALPTDAAPLAPAAALPPPAPLPPSPTVAAPAPASPPFEPAWLVAAWMLGVLACAGRMLAAQTRVWRLTRRCPRFPLAAPEAVGFAALKNGPAGTPPMVWGWPRVTLLLPPESAAWPQTRLRAVLLHEAAHVRRQDWLTQTLTQAACALYWFNPLVWLLAARLQSEAERAADDAVLLAGVPPADYAQDLLAVARALSSGGKQRRASLAAVTMARRSTVRGRLEAILDARRPRRRLTRRAAAFAFAVALTVAAPLAALRPAAHADEAPQSQTAPTQHIPTEADLAKVERHLQNLEEARAEYAAAHPNTLTAAQIAQADELTYQADLKRGRDRFTDREAADYVWAKAESKKPHTMQERKGIWRTIFSYEHRPPRVIKEEHDFALYFARLTGEVDAFPAGQAARESHLYALDSEIALSRTRAEAMQMERAEGYSLHLSEDEITAMRDLGFHSEKSGQASRADSTHVFLLFSKIDKHKPIDDADIDSLIAILREPSKAPNEARLNIMGLFHRLPNASPVQQQKIREAVTPFLTSQDKWERKYAEGVMKKFGGGVTEPTPAPKAQAVPAPPHQLTPQTVQTGVSAMTPRIILKPMLLKMAAFTALAAALTPPAAQAEPPAPAPKPAVPALAAGRLHWETIVVQHTTLGAIRALTGWDRGSTLPEGVSRVYFLESNGSILFQTTRAGSTHMREAVKAIETAPQTVQLRVTFAAITEADLNALMPRFYEVPLDSQGAMVKWLRVFRQGTDVSALAAFLAVPANQKAVVVAPVTKTDINVAATINIVGAPLMPGPRSAQLVATPRIDKAGFLTLQMVVPSLLPTGADGNAPPPVQILRPVSSGTPVVLVDSLPPATGGGNRYLLICITPTAVPGAEPAR